LEDLTASRVKLDRRKRREGAILSLAAKKRWRDKAAAANQRLASREDSGKNLNQRCRLSMIVSFARGMLLNCGPEDVERDTKKESSGFGILFVRGRRRCPAKAYSSPVARPGPC
jgi:hypothetical protein